MLSPASRAHLFLYNRILGLTPQALCCRPLRGLVRFFIIAILGLAPQAYAVARFASFCLRLYGLSRSFASFDFQEFQRFVNQRVGWSIDAGFVGHADDCAVLCLEFRRFSGSDVTLH